MWARFLTSVILLTRKRLSVRLLIAVAPIALAIGTRLFVVGAVESLRYSVVVQWQDT